MFNRQPFNRGKFNAASVGQSSPTGIATIALKSNPVQINKMIHSAGSSNIAMKDNVNATIVKYSSSNANAKLVGSIIVTKVYIAECEVSNLVMSTSASQLLSGEEGINLEGLTLAPGDELIINTTDYTVTLNGQNAVEFTSGESEFFNLLSGLNTIVYNDNSITRDVTFDIIWKDRWL